MLEPIQETILAGHYQVVKHLGSGGFGQTFLAKDIHIDGNSWCVVKKLKPRATDPQTLFTAKRLFKREVQTLSRLGDHDQIPRLLDHFEQDEDFYLVQEFIEGETLDQEFTHRERLSESEVIALLQDILQVLVFVHQQNVIHRDIKPANIIRCSGDSKIVLIDFGAVKEVSNQVVNTEGHMSLTVAVGSPGYMPNEQLAGTPHFSSDIYAVGMVGIRALTGVHPRNLTTDLRTSEISWHNGTAQVSPELAAILDKMVRYDFRDRYPTALEALEALENLQRVLTGTVRLSQIAHQTTEALPSHELQPPPTNPLRPKERLGSPQRSHLPRLASTVISPAMTKIQFLNKALPLLAVFAAMGVGMTFLMTKMFIFPQFANQTADLKGILSEFSTNKPASPSPESSPTQKPASGSAPSSEKTASSPAKSSSGREPSVAELLSQAHRLREAGEYEKAIATYDQALVLKSDIAEAQWGRCYSLNKLQRATEASAACDRALALKPNYPEALWSKGYALDQQKNYQEALNRFDQAIDLKPNFAEAWSNRGAVLLELGRPSEAVEAFDKATALNPNYVEAWANRGAALWNLKRYDEAIASIDKALKIQPDHQNALNLRKQAQEKLGH
jgi:serine/threonine protein kinase/regulator of sirC expression with transglutaminase-like and TPR domain